MDEWIEQLKSEFDIDTQPDIDVILNVARDAAHHVARPAAPVTTFLMGVAVAHGISPVEFADRVSRLVASRQEPA